LRERVLDLRTVRDIDLGAFKACNLIFASGKYRLQFDTQLSTTAKNRDSLHVPIMTRLGLLANFDLSEVFATTCARPSQTNRGK
jgi:hypothetical protein